MSDNPFWIHDAQTLRVSDECVYALIAVLESLSVELRSTWSDLIPRDSSGARFLIDPTPPVEMSRARTLLGDVLDDLVWLRGALVAYSEQVALQEQARAVSWTEPAERILAISASVMTGTSPEGAWGDEPLAHAATILSTSLGASSRVVVHETRGDAVSALPPRSIGDRVARIPAAESHIRIERYVDARGEAHSEVYIAGTKEWAVTRSTEPFDMASNIGLVAGVPAASLVSVSLAMARAGIMPGDRVSFTGHSQGGVIAARLAESGRYHTTGLLVVGSPTGTLALSGNYPALALRHSDDLVPRLGGSDHGSGFTTIERRSGRPVGDLVGAHQKSGYLDTARAYDASPASPHLPALPSAQGSAEVRVFSARRVGD